MKYVKQHDFRVIHFIGVLIFLSLNSELIQADRLYVTHTDDSFVSVIDTVSKNVVTTIPVGEYPTQIIAHPAGTYVYVVTGWSQQISVIETKSNQVIQTISTDTLKNPLLPDVVNILQVAAHPTDPLIYIATYERTASRNPSEGHGGITIVDVTQNKPIAFCPTRNYPTYIAVSPAGKDIYVSYNGIYQNQFSKINSSISEQQEMKVTDLAVVSTEDMPMITISEVVIDPTGTYLYISDTVSKKIFVMETKTNKAIVAIPVGNYPKRMIINPTGSQLYVLNVLDRTISVINTFDNSVIATIPVIDELGLSAEEMQQNPSLSEMAMNASGTRLYVTVGSNSANVTNMIGIIDLNANKVVEKIITPEYKANVGIALVSTTSGGGKAINSSGIFVETVSGFEGGISIDRLNYLTQLNVLPSLTVTAKGRITVDPADMGKQADLLWVTGIESNAPFDGGVDTTYFVIDEMGNASTVDLYNQPAVWMNQVADKPFKRNVTLQKETVIDEITLGYPNISSSINYHFMGYRLQDGTLIYSQTPIIANIQ